MKRGKKIWALLGLLAAALFPVCVIAGSHKADEARLAKARYFYMEGARLDGEGRHGEAHEFYKRAYETDPSYPEGAYAYGHSRLYIPSDSLQSPAERLRSMEMMRTFVERYPDDIDELLNYGFVALRLDTVSEALRVLERANRKYPSNTAILALLSEAYGRNGDYLRAAGVLEEFGNIEGTANPQLALRIMSHYISASDTAGAIAAADKFISDNRTDPAFRILKGNLYDVFDRPEEALRMYLEADSLAPESGTPKLALAEYYLNVGDSAAYERNLPGILLAEDLEFDQKHDLLASYLQEVVSGKRDTATGDYLFSVLSSQYPHKAEMRDLAARYAAAKKDYEKAQEEISYAIDQDPYNDIYWGQKITYQMMADTPEDMEKALATYDEAMKYVKPTERLRWTKALAATVAGKPEVAREVYMEEIGEKDPGLIPFRRITLSDVRKDISLDDLDKVSELMTNIGDLFQREEQSDSAFIAYENAIDLNASNYMAKNNYAYFMSLQGKDLEYAHRLILDVIDSPEGSSPTYLDTYAWILHLLGKDEDAADNQKRAIDLAKMDDRYLSPELFQHYVEILNSLGRRQEMEAALADGASYGEEYAEVLLPLADKYVKGGREKIERMMEDKEEAVDDVKVISEDENKE